MNATVNLTKRVPTEKGWRFCSVVYAANGRVRPNVVLLDGSEQRITEGAYYIEWRNPKRKRECVGKDAAEAYARKGQKEAELKAMRHGIEIVSPVTNGNGHRRSIAAAIQTVVGRHRTSRQDQQTPELRASANAAETYAC